jgi:mono/diheme cytochrome c family protein
MTIRTVSALALTAALFASVGVASVASAAPAPQSHPATAAELATGAAVYGRTCILCHGPDGKGVPNMGNELKMKDVAAIKDKVAKGMVNPGDKMPPMGATSLSPEELEGVAKYIAAGLPK